MNETARRLAWSVWGVTLALLPFAGLLVYLNRSSLNSAKGDQFLFISGAVSVFAYGTVGALITSRRSGNRIGWALSGIALGLSVTMFAGQFAARALVIAPGSLPFGRLAAWLQNWVPVPSISLIVFVFLLFPTGHVASRRWRPILWAATVGTAVLTLAWMFKPGPINQSFGSLGSLRVTNPVGIGHVDGVVDSLLVGATFVVLVAAAASIASLVVRFRRSSGEERQQIRWLALVGAATGIIFVSQIPLNIICPDGSSKTCDLLSGIAFSVFFLTLAIGIPVACGVAILRYRLWDLDLVIRKTVIAVVTAIVFALAAGALIGGFTIFSIGVGDKRNAAILGIAFGMLIWPTLRLSRRLGQLMAYGKRATPYQVLSSFSERVGETYSTDDVLPRMAHVLGEATGAAVATVWLALGRELHPAASWPEEVHATPVAIDGEALPVLAGEDAVEVRHRGELLGALSVRMPANDPMNPAKERLARDLAAQAGLVLRNVRLIEDLRESRRRIVTAQDERAKALERNIHDGAQQQLVALIVKLRLLEQLAPRDTAKAAEMASQLQAEATEALENLRDLARGIYPPLLADRGLAEALDAQARKAPILVTVDSDGVGRYRQEIESAVYFCCLEALQNVAKYAHATHAEIRLSGSADELAFTVIDDGDGFDPTTTGYGTGLQGMADRLDAIGGTLEVGSNPGMGTTVTGRIPPREPA